MFKKILLTLCLTFGLSAASFADDSDWLVGVWQLDSGEKVEYLEFGADNKVTLISDRGRKVPGNYQVAGDKLKVIYNFKGKKIPIEMSISPEKNMLTAAMTNTGKTAMYKKNA